MVVSLWVIVAFNSKQLKFARQVDVFKNHFIPVASDLIKCIFKNFIKGGFPFI